jgi:hypothetical protein
MKPTQYTTPADFGVWEVAYKVSETDFNMKRSLAKASINEWAHQGDVVNVKTQQVVRENQDVIYSSAMVDIRKGATICVPKSDNYHIIQILDMQNYTVEVLYPGESAAITPDRVTYGSYVYLNMRIRKLPEEKGGLQTTHKLQRMARIEAKSAIPYASPDIVVDPATLEKVRRALVKDVYEGKAGTDTSASMGTPYDTDPQLHLYATAYGWGGLAVAHAGYVPITRNQTKIHDGKALPSSLTFTPPEINESRGGLLVGHHLRRGRLDRQRQGVDLQLGGGAERRRFLHHPLQLARQGEQPRHAGTLCRFAPCLRPPFEGGDRQVHGKGGRTGDPGVTVRRLA